MQQALGLIIVVLAATPVLAQCGPPFAEDFEGQGLVGLPAGFSQTASSFAFTLHSGATPSQLTGPSGDFNSGQGRYLYAEATGVLVGEQAILRLPCVDLQGVFNPHLQFAFHMWGIGMGALEVQAEDAMGQWSTIFSRVGNQGNQWIATAVRINPRADGTARLRFVATRGLDHSSDIAIDAVQIGQGQPPRWQENRPGSELVIDGALVRSPLGPKARTVVLPPQSVTAQASAFGLALAYDVLVTLEPSVDARVAGRSTLGLQSLNLNPAVVSFQSFFGGRFGLAFQPWPGDFQIPLQSAVPVTAAAQLVTLCPTEQEGFALSQAAEVEWSNDPCLISPALPLSDDSSIVALLGFQFRWYGGITDRVFVGSNGLVTLLQGRSNWPTDARSFASDVPCMAILGADFDPSQSGSIHFGTNGTGSFCVRWTDVPSFGVPGSRNSFELRYFTGGDLLFDYRQGFDELAGFVGITPGGFLLATSPWRAVDLSSRPFAVFSNETVYEDFSLSQNDLSGQLIHVHLDLNGFPTLID